MTQHINVTVDMELWKSRTFMIYYYGPIWPGFALHFQHPNHRSGMDKTLLTLIRGQLPTGWTSTSPLYHELRPWLIFRSWTTSCTVCAQKKKGSKCWRIQVMSLLRFQIKMAMLDFLHQGVHQYCVYGLYGAHLSFLDRVYPALTGQIINGSLIQMPKF